MTAWRKIGVCQLALLLIPQTVQAATVIGKVQIDPQILVRKPATATWTSRNRVLLTGYIPTLAPIVYLKGLRNTEDTKPTHEPRLQLNRFGPHPAHQWALKGTPIELSSQEEKQPLQIEIAHQQKTVATYRLQAGKPLSHTFTKTGIYTVRVVPRKEEIAHILVVDSHYVTTLERGVFRLSKLPPGTAQLEVWYRGHVLYQQQVEVPEEMDSVERLTIRIGSSISDQSKTRKKPTKSSKKTNP